MTNKILIFTLILFSMTSCSKSKMNESNLKESRTFASELPLSLDQSGSLNVGIVYAYDQDWVWQITFHSKLQNNDIASLPEKIFWNIIVTTPSGSHSQLLDSSKEITKNMLIVGQLKSDSPIEVKNILLKQTEASVVFLAHEGGSLFRELYKISLRPICEMTPRKVTDLTNTDRAPCSVTSSDFPDQAAECKNSEIELLQWVTDKLVTCSIAKDIHKDRGCGDLKCQD